MTNGTSTSRTLLSLPDELILHIMHHLPTLSLLRLSHVSYRLYNLSYTPSLHLPQLPWLLPTAHSPTFLRRHRFKLHSSLFSSRRAFQGFIAARAGYIWRTGEVYAVVGYKGRERPPVVKRWNASVEQAVMIDVLVGEVGEWEFRCNLTERPSAGCGEGRVWKKKMVRSREGRWLPLEV